MTKCAIKLFIGGGGGGQGMVIPSRSPSLAKVSTFTQTIFQVVSGKIH